MNDSIHYVSGIFVGGCVYGFDAAALIDCDIDDHRSGLHCLEIAASNQFWRDSAGNEHCTNHEVRGGDLLQDVMTIGVDEGDVRRHHVGEIAEPLKAEVEHRHLRAES